MEAYRTVISFKYPEPFQTESGKTEYVEKIKYLPIDYLDDRNISANSKIVTQPLQNGDTMSDHMYREPIRETIKGKFSLNGRNWNNDSYNFMFRNDRLTSIQYVFEYIKNTGTLCTLTSVISQVDGADCIYYDSEGNLKGNINPAKTRFLTRENMALTGISWTEKVNVLDFDFNFEEVIMIDSESYEIDPTDITLPQISSPKTQSVGTLLFDTGELPLMVTQTLYDNGYIEDDWLRALNDMGTTIIGTLATLLVFAASVGIIALTISSITSGGLALTALGGAAASVFPVGTIIAAGAVAIGAIAFGIASLINYWNKKEKEKKAFKLVNGDPKPDFNRYCNLLDDIEMAVNKASSNIAIYSFPNDEQMQISLSIGGNYYFITFNSINEDPYWNTEITLNGFGEKGNSIGNCKRGNFPVITDFSEMDENVNLWFKDINKEYQVYLVNPSLALDKTEAEYKENAKALSTYSIWIIKGSAKETVKTIENAIMEALYAHDFN